MRLADRQDNASERHGEGLQYYGDFQHSILAVVGDFARSNHTATRAQADARCHRHHCRCRDADDPHYLKIKPTFFETLTDFKKDRQTGFCFSYIKNGEKELTNVSNWDEISFLYSCVCWLKHTTLDYLDIPVIVYEDPQLVLLIRQIRRSSFIWSVEMKHSMSFCIISEMSKNIQKFYSLYLSLCKYAKQMNELHVGDEEAAKLLSIPVNYK